MRVTYPKVRNVERLANGQRGFTLVELIMAMCVASIIMAAASYGILHTFNMNTRNTNYMTAVRQVQNAGYWVSHDAEMARPETASTTTPGFLLRLTWFDSNNLSVTHFCDYTLESGVLFRKLDSSPKTLVAEHITSATFNPVTLNADGHITSFVFNVTATVTARQITGTEMRKYEVALRPGTQ